MKNRAWRLSRPHDGRIAPFYAADGITCLLEQADLLTAHAPSCDLAFAREPSVVEVCLQTVG